MENCINCKSTTGMSSHHALGLWQGDTYRGGICPNCIFYPERQTSTTIALIAECN